MFVSLRAESSAKSNSLVEFINVDPTSLECLTIDSADGMVLWVAFVVVPWADFPFPVVLWKSLVFLSANVPTGPAVRVECRSSTFFTSSV